MRAYKGTAIKVGDKGEATVLFDRNQLRLAAAWTGGFLNHSQPPIRPAQHADADGHDGVTRPRGLPVGRMTKANFDEPVSTDRTVAEGVGEIQGHLPERKSHGDGLYRRRVRRFCDRPWTVPLADEPQSSDHIEIGPIQEPKLLCLAAEVNQSGRNPQGWRD